MRNRTKVKILIAAVLLGGIIYCAYAGVKAVAIAHADTFDHSQCQYPDRTTNPDIGCDNSDPCDPAQTKGGSGDCLPGKDAAPPNPDRPYFDQYGNQYDYQGNLISPAATQEATVPVYSCGK